MKRICSSYCRSSDFLASFALLAHVIRFARVLAVTATHAVFGFEAVVIARRVSHIMPALNLALNADFEKKH